MPISLGITPRLVHDATGEPVAHVYVALGHDEDGRVVADERCFTREDGRLGVPADAGWQTRAPLADARRPEGQVVRLHWSYGHETDEELAALPLRAWSTVTVADEVRLRPSRPRGRVHVRVLRPGTPPTPLAGATCRLHPPSDLPIAPLEVTTDADGLLTLDDVEAGLWRLEADAGHARVEPRPPRGAPATVLLAPLVDEAPEPEAPRAGVGVATDDVPGEPDAPDTPEPRDDADDEIGVIPDVTEQEGDVGVLDETFLAELRGVGVDA